MANLNFINKLKNMDGILASIRKGIPLSFNIQGETGQKEFGPKFFMREKAQDILKNCLPDVDPHRMPINWHMQQYNKLHPRMANPIAANQADYVNWVIYDRTTIAAGATPATLIKLFTVPIGTSSKTKVDTNLDAVSTLPNPYWMNVETIGFFFNPNVAQLDLTGFLAAEYMEFWVLNKVYAEGPLQYFPSGAGIYGGTNWGTMTAAAANNSQIVSNGWPALSNQFDLRLPQGLALGKDPGTGQTVVADGYTGVTILQSQTFNVQIKADGGATALLANNATPIVGVGLTLACYIKGILSRSVQ